MKRVSQKFSTKILSTRALSQVGGGAIGIGYVLEAASSTKAQSDMSAKWSATLDGIAQNYK